MPELFIISAYNGEKYIRQCYESIASQLIIKLGSFFAFGERGSR